MFGGWWRLAVESWWRLAADGVWQLAVGGGCWCALRGGGGSVSLPASRAVLKEKKGGFVTPTETNVHGDALRFMGKTWARHKTTETVLNNGWPLAAVGGWRRLAVGGWWSLGAVLLGCA